MMTWGWPGALPAEEGKIILCSTFPVYQITRNVAQGGDPAAIRLMLPASMGCPHDYVLSPQDMQQLSLFRVVLNYTLMKLDSGQELVLL